MQARRFRKQSALSAFSGILLSTLMCQAFLMPSSAEAQIKRLADLPTTSGQKNVGDHGSRIKKASLPGRPKATKSVSEELILSLVTPVLEEQGFSADTTEVKIDQNKDSFFLVYDTEKDIQLTSWELNDRRNRLTAILESQKNLGTSFTCHVHLHPLVEVPVLAHSIGVDHLVGSDDIRFIKVQARKVSRHSVTKTEDLLGAFVRPSAARPLHVLKKTDIRRPQLIKRGQNVSLVVKNGQLSLETVAKALESGELGQQIRLVNPQSNRSLQATVVAAGKAEINLTRPQILEKRNVS